MPVRKKMHYPQGRLSRIKPVRISATATYIPVNPFAVRSVRTFQLAISDVSDRLRGVIQRFSKCGSCQNEPGQDQDNSSDRRGHRKESLPYKSAQCDIG